MRSAVRRPLLARALVAGPLATALALLLVVARPGRLSAGGEFGHRLVGRRAAAALPREMPAFFRNAGAQLEYLNPEPDRWRERAERELDPALDGATAPDHFIDLELVPAEHRAALLSPTRYAFADSLEALQLEPAKVGLLPFRIVELTQELRTLYELEKASPFAPTNGDAAHRRFAAARLAAGATMLRDLWWTAWVTSGQPILKER
jgi:hypothetical protein